MQTRTMKESTRKPRWRAALSRLFAAGRVHRGEIQFQQPRQATVVDLNAYRRQKEAMS